MKMNLNQYSNLISSDKYILTMKVCNKIIRHFLNLDTDSFINKFEDLQKLEKALSKNCRYNIIIYEANSDNSNFENSSFIITSKHVPDRNKVNKKEISQNLDIFKDRYANPDIFVDSISSECMDPTPLITPEIPDKIIKSFPCNICNKSLSSEKFLNRHKQLCGAKKIKCTICGQLLLRSYYHTHFARHSKTKKYKCDMCGKSFLEKKGLDQHLVTHGVIKKHHLCTTCGRIFKDHTQLHKHNLEAHVGRRFTCTICAKKFTRNFDLKMHLVRHTNIKKFKCEMCNKNFLTKKCLRRHIKLHGMNYPYFCDVCQSTFLQKCDFKNHIKTHGFFYK